MRPALLAAVALLAAGPAAADGVRVPEHPLYREECGSCHVPYPPQLLSPQSWREIMANLGRHFGSDASLEPALAQEIEGYLAQHAGRRAGTAARITETRWFLKEHRDEIPRGRNAADCAACHAGAEKGIYED